LNVTKPKKLKPPALSLHKPSGRAFVMARDENGKRRMIYLGKHGTAEAERNYRQFLSEFYAGHPLRVPQPKKTEDPDDALTVEGLCAEFLLHAESRYRKQDGTSTGEALNFAHAFRQLLKLYRDIPAAKFDVTMLEAVQQAMVRDDLARSCVNNRVSRIRRAYRWAARKKLVPASVWHELQALPGLHRGEHAVREAPGGAGTGGRGRGGSAVPDAADPDHGWPADEKATESVARTPREIQSVAVARDVSGGGCSRVSTSQRPSAAAGWLLRGRSSRASRSRRRP
jgi:hypothetical protein